MRDRCRRSTGWLPVCVALDTPPQEVQPLVDMGDQGLFLRQAQAHRGQDPDDLLAEGFGVAFGAMHDQAPVVGLCRVAGYADRGGGAAGGWEVWSEASGITRVMI